MKYSTPGFINNYLDLNIVYHKQSVFSNFLQNLIFSIDNQVS